MRRSAFFDSIRPTLFAGSLTQQQVNGIERLLDAWENYWGDLEPWGPVMRAQCAYVLATTYHETARKMWPVKEFGGERYYHRMYDIEGDRPHIAKALGNCQPGDGVRFCGRGDVQNTGRRNYQRMSDKLGIDLVGNPELMLDPAVSAEVLISGMVDGDFTGHTLNNYIDQNGFDFVGARRIINGTDKAARIAGYAAQFMTALDEAVKPVTPKIRPEPEPEFAELNPSPALSPSPKYRPPDYVTLDSVSGEVIKSWDAEPGDPGAAVYEPEPVLSEKKPKMLKKIDGWKTHIGMVISGGIGIAAMLGLIPGLDAETGARMLQTAFGVSGFRSAIPKFIEMGISLYLKQQLRKSLN